MESDRCRFLNTVTVVKLKGSVGLILLKDSVMRVTIPLDLSTQSFIPLPRIFHSRRAPPLLTSFLVLFPQHSSKKDESWLDGTVEKETGFFSRLVQFPFSRLSFRNWEGSVFSTPIGSLETFFHGNEESFKINFFFTLVVQIEQRKESKAPKIRFSKSGKRTHFSGVQPACNWTVLM